MPKLKETIFICLPLEFLPVSEPLIWWCASTLGAALLYSSRASSWFRLYHNCDINYYHKYFTTLIIWNILKDSNYCFDSLAIRIQSNDLKTPYPKNQTPDYRVSIYIMVSLIMEKLYVTRCWTLTCFWSLLFLRKALPHSSHRCFFSLFKTRSKILGSILNLNILESP